MRRFATVLLALSTASVAAGCGGHVDRDRMLVAPGSAGIQVLALPDGHPPLAEYGQGLPPGHPVCPAGRQMLERGADGHGGADEGAPQIISI